MNANTVLGILGSGQLSRMTALAAHDLGIKTHVLCNEAADASSPASAVANFTTKSDFNNIDKILEFTDLCDYITLENEFIDQSVLDLIEQLKPGKLYPSAETFKYIGDKITEKNTFAKAGIAVCPYQEVTTKSDVLEFIKNHGLPVVLKSAKGGYDGYGNITIQSEDMIDEALLKLKGRKLVEAFVAYKKEIAIMAARNDSGTVYYPIAETIQENHICHYVMIAADMSPAAEAKIKEYTDKALVAIRARGLFAFEFFLTPDDQVYLNESAPRPHNSGHYSMNACVTSQFHNHVRSVMGLPLGETTLTSKHTVMLNLLGTKNQIAQLEPLAEFLKVKSGHLHLYGKTHSKPGRKMGHFTICGNNKDEIFTQAKKLKEIYSL
ncbi:MAG: 5-(carboxyamino)imidazole ribonucleotide synthase [Bdellovibrionota bacterium]